MTEDFIDSAFLQDLAVRCERDHVALAGKDTAAFLRALMQTKQTKTLLEIGTGYGYSTFCWAEAMAPWQGRVLTMERLVERAQIAENLGAQAGFANITFICGMVPGDLYLLAQPCDGIFVDAAIGQYLTIWRYLAPYVQPGGFFAADNIHVKNLLGKARDEIPHRHRTIYARLHELLREVERAPGWRVRRLDLGDGLLLAEKLEGSHD